jgi:AmmeMemoRadiSam system protein A
MVPLFFIRQKLPNCKIIRLGLSGLPLTDHYKMGLIIQKAIDKIGRKVIYIASGDLSHKLKPYGPYGFSPEGPEYDARIMDVCKRAAFEELFDFEESFLNKAAECGHRSFVIMAGALDGLSVKAEKLSHEATFGVGYGICRFEVGGPDESRHFLDIWRKEKLEELQKRQATSDPYVKLARYSLESYVTGGKTIHKKDLTGDEWKDLPDELFNTKAGAFVSIHKNGALRGCIGTISATCDCVAEEILQNAISAGTADPRFNMITADELPWLEINVDVMGIPEPISSTDLLDVKKYGVIVTSGTKRGLLLPNLDGVDSVNQQINIACQKAGIPAGEEIYLERFEVVRHI